jgi:hypothetical protein
MTYEAEVLEIGRTDDLRIKLLAQSDPVAQCEEAHMALLHSAPHETMRQPCAASRIYLTYMLHDQSLDINAQVHEVEARHVRSRCGIQYYVGGLC